jgi:hypothetical protein
MRRHHGIASKTVNEKECRLHPNLLVAGFCLYRGLKCRLHCFRLQRVVGPDLYDAALPGQDLGVGHMGTGPGAPTN